MASRSFKQYVAIGAAAAVLGGATLGGVALAQQATPTPGTPGTRTAPGQDHRQEYLNALAGKLGTTAERLQQAMEEVRKDLGLPEHGPKHGPGGPRRGGGPGPGLDAAAQAIGITSEQLRQELPGKSLADVAKAHNVDTTKVAQALKADAEKHLDEAVQAGRLTADQANSVKANLQARIDEMMNRIAGQGGPRGFGKPGRHGAGFGIPRTTSTS
jgi:hypothetical protein